jgi:hypothetical protein
MNEHESKEAQQPAGEPGKGRVSRGFWPGFGTGIGTILLLALGVIVLIALICAVAMTRGCGMDSDMMDGGMMSAASASETVDAPDVEDRK